MLTAQMIQLETELINKDLGAEASPEKVAAVIAAQVETSHTHKDTPVQMQLQEQQEPPEGGDGLPVSKRQFCMWVKRCKHDHWLTDLWLITSPCCAGY